jgi:RNA polymerase sigma-70 factor (ECF subfamily)
VTTAEVFEAHRPRLLGIAYGMLGGLAEAEDVVQDAYLRWHDADESQIRSAEAFLVTVTTRLAIDRLRSARVRRETYVGPWLPEPLVADEAAPDPADVVAEAEQLSLAILTTLERLNPVERAVLLLRDVFDLDYAEIADVVDRSPVNVRQIATRARGHVGDVHRHASVTAEEEQRLLEAFMGAVTSGDLDGLTELLAADAVMYSDGGGVVQAARKPIHSGPKVARFFIGIARKAPPEFSATWVRVNGEPGVCFDTPGGVLNVMAFEIRDGLVTAVRVVANPEKLGYAARGIDSRRARSSSSSSTSRRMS